MVKKILFLSTFLLITIISNINVNAMPLGYPETWAYFDDGSHLGPDSATIYNWWNQQYYKSPYLMGGVSSAQYINRLDFNFNNANLCSNQDISIDGSIGALYSFFNEQSYTLVAYSNSLPLTCSTNVSDAGSKLNFKCYGKGGGSLNFFLYQNSYSLVKQYDVGISREMTISCDVSNQEIVNQSITNTQNIINNQNSNTNTITQNQDTNTQNIINNQNSNTNQIIQDNQQNTQDIINNQNQNTQQEIESQKVCNIIDNQNIFLKDRYLISNGTTTSSDSTYGITDYINIYNSTIERLSSYGNNPSLCYYNINQQLISCLAYSSISNNILTIPSDAYYVRFSINYNQNKPQFKICKNGNQALTDSVNDLNDTLKDDNPPDTENQLNDLDDSLISDTPITDLITLPITLLNSYINGFSGSCSPYNLGNLYGTDLIFPCINLQQYLGSNLWIIIDSLFSIFMIYNLAMLMIQAFEGFTSLRDDYEGLYQPRHADTGYQPKHGGGS